MTRWKYPSSELEQGECGPGHRRGHEGGKAELRVEHRLAGSVGFLRHHSDKESACQGSRCKRCGFDP